MPIREESYDLFGYANAGVYYPFKAFTSSAVTGNVLDLRSPEPAVAAEYRLDCVIGTAGAGGTSAVVTVEHSADGTNWSTLETGASVLVAGMTKGASMLSMRLPKHTKRYIRAKITPTGTFTAGTVGGNVEAIV